MFARPHVHYASLCAWYSLLQVHEMKSARDSGELQMDTLKDEIDQLRTWKEKVAGRCDCIVFDKCSLKLSTHTYWTVELVQVCTGHTPLLPLIQQCHSTEAIVVVT